MLIIDSLLLGEFYIHLELIKISEQKIKKKKESNNSAPLMGDEIFPKRFNFQKAEAKWIKRWEEMELYKFNFGPTEDKENIFSIDTPPDFTSGNLHMGHILNHTWIDFMARFRRLEGKNVYFPQGFDCHGLPTELKVQQLTGINPTADRTKFLATCRQYTEQFIGNMSYQFNQIGYSTDWTHTYRTMDPEYIRLVQLSLVDFYKKGLLYRGKHPVHWCPRCETSLAKQEVGYVERPGKIWEIKLPLEQENEEYIHIATTRPEMMEACVAVFVNPKDERFMHFLGKSVRIPLTSRTVPIIGDHEVDYEFGTGAVYCCTFGDETDIGWQKKYHLPIIQIIAHDGRMSETSRYAGLTAKNARKDILAYLDGRGLLAGEQQYNHRVIVHIERSACQAPIEYLPIPQWFINVKDFTAQIRQDGKNLTWYPDLSRRLTDWCDNLTWDWVVSRQRVFGTPIPFWRCSNPACDYIELPELGQLPLDPTKIKPKQGKCPKCDSKIVGEKDVCDCWVDSSITPLVISKWNTNKQFFDMIYPATCRPQGYEIIRTWMFYTLYRCRQLTGQPPFSETMINGMVAGPDGRKMSKSFGNVVTPDEVLPVYGADAIRLWAAAGPPGNDYPFKFHWVDRKNRKQRIGKKILSQLAKLKKGILSQPEFDAKYMKDYPIVQAKAKYITKIWNAFRLLWLEKEKYGIKDFHINPKYLTAIDSYVYTRFRSDSEAIRECWNEYRWHDGMRTLRSLFKDLLCDNYLETLKHRFHSEDFHLGKESIQIALHLFYRVLIIFGVIVPFIAEEIHTLLFGDITGTESIHLARWPQIDGTFDPHAIQVGKTQIGIIEKIRSEKGTQNLPLNSQIKLVRLHIPNEQVKLLKNHLEPVKVTLNLVEIELISAESETGLDSGIAIELTR